MKTESWEKWKCEILSAAEWGEGGEEEEEEEEERRRHFRSLCNQSSRRSISPLFCPTRKARKASFGRPTDRPLVASPTLNIASLGNLATVMLYSGHQMGCWGNFATRGGNTVEGVKDES